MFIPLYRASAAAFCLSLVLAAAPAMAVTQIPQSLTLGDALAWAQKYNPTVRAGEIRIERLTGRANHAGVAVPSNPRVELEAGQRSNRIADTTDRLNANNTEERRQSIAGCVASLWLSHAPKPLLS